MGSSRLTRNLGYKVMALVIAVVLWMGILNAEDPVITREFSGISVSEVNADVITSADKAYSYVDGIDTVNVRVSGRTSMVNNVQRADISAVVDLSKLSDTTGAVPVDVSCDRYPSLEVSTEGSSGILRIEIEDLDQKALNIQVETSGAAAEGKYIGKGVATPNLVSVSGPKSVVDNVAGAVVQVAVSEQNTADITTNSEVKLLNASGGEIGSSRLTLSESVVSVTVPIYNTKTIPVSLDLSGSPKEGYNLLSFEYQPKEVTIAGPSRQLDKISELILSDYDISDAQGKIEESLVIADNLSEKLPDGVVLTDTASAIALALDIEKSGEETYNLPVDHIQLNGSSAGLNYRLSGDTAAETIPVILSGTTQRLSSVTADSLRGRVNVSGLAAGEYDLTVEIELPVGLTLAGHPTVHLEISKEEETE